LEPVKQLLIFDMDGVLVDVTASYREAITQTVAQFTGCEITNQQIQDYKNQGGWNDDWQLSHHIITKTGAAVPFAEVKAYFQSIFLGENGLIMREQWVARPGSLEKLNERFHFALFTGRPRKEAEFTLKRFAPEMRFDPIVGMYEVQNHKPAPDGLLRIVRDHSPAPGSQSPAPAFYVGDTVDDARCAKAARVPFIGVAAPSSPCYRDLVCLFEGEGAYAIVDDINGLEEVLAS
jgi:HAD superfamily phosphatase